MLAITNKYHGSLDFYTQVFKEPNDFNVVNNLAHLNLKVKNSKIALVFQYGFEN